MPDLTIVVRRVLFCHPQEAYAAWTEPEELAHWWCRAENGGRVLHALRADVRPGGEFHFDSSAASGERQVITGTYVRVEPPALLEWTWSLDGAVPELVTAAFDPHELGCEISIRHRRGCRAGRKHVARQARRLLVLPGHPRRAAGPSGELSGYPRLSCRYHLHSRARSSADRAPDF
jgi:uncharacterized protein YndB with AHSA1/START domain